jgi:antitoxin ChpS
MHRTSLRRVGGSVMLAVPPAMLSAVGLEPGASVGIRADGDRLVVERMRPRYSLDQLLAEHAEGGAERDAEWLAGGAVGREEI